MIPFDLVIALNDARVNLHVKKLDVVADENRFVRYEVLTDGRQAAISVDLEEIFESPDFSFEAVQPSGESFDGNELLQIINAIKANIGRVYYPLHFNRLPCVN